MGLDMYLVAKQYVPLGADERTQKILKTVLDTDYEIGHVELKIGYWRKANHIHKWFVDNVQEGVDDCGEYYVTREKLRELLNAVDQALKSDHPENILPTQSGFFFGGTEYDGYYKQSLQHTKEIIEKFMALPNKNKYDLYYHSSW